MANHRQNRHQRQGLQRRGGGHPVQARGDTAGHQDTDQGRHGVREGRELRDRAVRGQQRRGAGEAKADRGHDHQRRRVQQRDDAAAADDQRQRGRDAGAQRDLGPADQGRHGGERRGRGERDSRGLRHALPHIRVQGTYRTHSEQNN